MLFRGINKHESFCRKSNFRGEVICSALLDVARASENVTVEAMRVVLRDHY